MSFGSSVRFEVRDGDKGGIFWEKEKPRHKPKNFGYKSKSQRHDIRKPTLDYTAEPVNKPKSSQNFIKKNRNQYKKEKQSDGKENHRSYNPRSRHTSSAIKPGTVTLTQDQLNALLATVGKLRPGEGSSLRISIDAENNQIKVESPKDRMGRGTNSACSGHSDQYSAQRESSIYDLTRDNKCTMTQDHRESSGYSSEEKCNGASNKEVRIDKVRNEEQMQAPAVAPEPPALVPWRHMTVGERKRLEWAREKAAAEQQKDQDYDPWGRPGCGAPQKKIELDPQANSQFKTKEEEKLRKAIDNIEAKYSNLLGSPVSGKDSSSFAPNQHKSHPDQHPATLKSGQDSGYNKKSGTKENKSSKSKQQLDDNGNARPLRKQGRERERKAKGEKEKKEGSSQEGRSRQEGKKKEALREMEEDTPGNQGKGATDQKSASTDNMAAGPAAMQTSLFLGQSEADSSRVLSKKELEKRQWLEELDRQREEKRLQKQKEKQKQREGLDDTWADRFVSETVRYPVMPHSQHQQLAPYATGGTYERSEVQVKSRSSAEVGQHELPPAAMRSAIGFGDSVASQDRIDLKQADEKRLWLEGLNKQREEQRDARRQLKEKQLASDETWADCFTQNSQAAGVKNASPRNALQSNVSAPASYQDSSVGRISSAPQPGVSQQANEPPTHLRGQNIQMDAVTRRELEEKRRKHLEYQAAIKAQIEEKERQKQQEREQKWREEMEEERKMKAEQEALQQQLEIENSKNRQKEVARQRQVEHLKSMMDAEQERAKEQRMIKRLVTLQKGGHDVSGLKAHYEALTPRPHQVDPVSLADSISPRDALVNNISSRPVPSTYRAGDAHINMHTNEEYMENRVLTPSRFRKPSQSYSHPSSPQREFATQTDDLQALTRGLQKEMSDVDIEYRHTSGDNKNVTTENLRAKPSVAKEKEKNQQQRPQKTDMPVKWNYQNTQMKSAMKQSERDPFFKRKKLEQEERRAKRERQLQYLIELNKQVIPTEKYAHHNKSSALTPHNGDADFVPDTDRKGTGHLPVVNGDISHRSRSPPVNQTGKYRPADRSHSPPVPSVRHKTGHSAAKDFETDYNLEAHTYHRSSPSFTPVVDERGNIKVPTKDTDFIPFTRTTDILDPSRAEEPMQLSRENTRIKQARQHYHENLRPADFGNQIEVYEDRQRQPAPRHKDPILNPGLVKDYPTARQDQILQQLSSLKQSLIQRQREIETCMSPSDLEKHV